MATQKIDQINYGGVTYKFVDSESQADIVVLNTKIDTVHTTDAAAINTEIARATAAENAIKDAQVSKEAGKGLSTNDFTDYYKGLLDNPTPFIPETETQAGKNGNVPYPTQSQSDLFLKGDGTWAKPTDTTYENATQSVSGLMSYTDKTRLDEMDDANDEQLASTTVIGDGTITTTYSSGKSIAYTFNTDGTISETLTTSYGSVKKFKTTFNGGTITKEVIS